MSKLHRSLQQSLLVTTEKSMLQLLREFLPQLSVRRRKQFLFLIGLMLVGAMAEIVTLGAVVPFIALMADPSIATQYPVISQVFTFLGWQYTDNIVLPMTLLFIFLLLMATSVRLLLLWVNQRFVHGVGYDLGVRLYERVLNQPYSFHVSRNTSQIIAATNKVQLLTNRVLSPLSHAIVNVIMVVAILATLLTIDPLAASVAGISFGLMYVSISRIVVPRLKANGRILAAAQTQRVQAVQEGLGGVRDVILDGTQAHYVKIFGKVDQRLKKAQATNAIVGAAPGHLVQALGMGLIVMLAYIMSTRTGGLNAALPVLAALALGAQRLLPLLQQLYSAWSNVVGNKQVFADVLELLMLQLPDRDEKNQPVISFDHAIKLDNISFRYIKNGPIILDSLSLQINKGLRIGLVGKTGSGKSTLVDIMMGLLHPSSGTLYVDDIAINDSNRRVWQQKIAHVPQSIYLTDATLAENIAFGVPEKLIDMQRVRESAQRAQIADHIEQLSEGYLTRVGERGVRLSGGQRQRIGIARALYKKADVLFFDEATSALDSETESNVIRCIDELDQDLTIIVIAHRVQTLGNCDVIVQLEQGCIQKTGSYDQIVGL